MTGQVFISYSSTDRPYVQRLAQYLQSFGLRVWYDPHIAVGEQFAKTIEREIDTSVAVIVVMSPAAAASKWVPREMEWADRQNKPILPLLLAGSVFFQYVNTHYENVSDGRLPSPQFVAELQRLAAAPPVGLHPPPPAPPVRAVPTRRARTWVVVALVPVVIVCGGATWGGVTVLRAIDGAPPGGASPEATTTGTYDQSTSQGVPTTPNEPSPTSTEEGSQQITVRASGGAPWTVTGYGWRYTVLSIERTTSEWMSGPQPSLTITAEVERTAPASAVPFMTYRVIGQDTGTALEEVPYQNSGDREPALHLPSRLVQVVWDASPRATRVTVVLHDLHWVDGKDLILSDLPVPVT